MTRDDQITAIAQFQKGCRLIAAVTVAAVVAFVVAATSYGKQLSQTRYATLQPPTNDPELTAFFNDPAVEWYTAAIEKPAVFQHRGRIHSIHEDIGPRRGRFSNGNGEWPWAHPATLQNVGAKNVIGAKITGYSSHNTAFRQYAIRRNGTPNNPGSVDAVLDRGTVPGRGWRFSAGTDIVELNTTPIAGMDVTCFVHRMTLQTNGEWLFRVYRPFSSREQYEKATGTKAVDIGAKTLRSGHLISAFKATRRVYKIPPIPAALSLKLLDSTPFMLCQDESFIPTTDARNQIYPQGYLGAFIGNATNQEDCRTCHKQVAVNVAKFDTGEWYGQIRGGGQDRHGAGVFSWYPPELVGSARPVQQSRPAQPMRRVIPCAGST